MIDHEEYVNTLDAFGDDVLTDAILTRSLRSGLIPCMAVTTS